MSPGTDLDTTLNTSLGVRLGLSRSTRIAVLLLSALATVAALAWLLPMAQNAFDSAVTLPLYRRLLRETLKLAALCAGLCLIAGYPLAWLMRLGSDRVQRTVLLGVVAPAVVSAVQRALGWVVVLGEFGLINLMLRTLRLEAEMPRSYFNHELAVVASMAQVFLPFTVLALYRSFTAVPLDTLRAARSLGVSPRRVFWVAVLPQTVQAALASVAVVFGLALGAYVTVVLIGGRRVRLLAGLAFQESTSLLDWQIGAVGVIAVAGGLYALVRWLTRDKAPEL